MAIDTACGAVFIIMGSRMLIQTYADDENFPFFPGGRKWTHGPCWMDDQPQGATAISIRVANE